ncbi:prolyl oligopeptidase family serine peptidase [Aquabacter sp. L1I39]|uniref:alpha/beta hydrolase family esterase n=1 Tax=Aquabacter sp. L1I39 TaxID=2820278 RepID=UPI001ADA60FF|nr:PHB depolymerase family esterase [Aquabacter sp. L1I39]QTL03204.1 prolyl oligopeptidase family serine peptidase [Aquabacter sp. L1I39]
MRQTAGAIPRAVRPFALMLAILVPAFWGMANAAHAQADPAAPNIAASNLAEEHIQVGREDRTYLISRPPGATGPAPTVIALHAAGQSSQSFRDYVGLDVTATPQGVVTVYPQGIGRVWNDGRPAAMRLKAILTPGDDVPFLILLVQRLVQEGIADPRRIYLLGISNGGFMVERMACEHAGLFAAFAVTMATAPANYREECAPSRPVPIMFVHGTADSVIGWFGFWTPLGATLSAPDSALLYAALDRCAQTATEPLADRDPLDGTSISLQTWTSCEGGAEVRLYKVEGGGHQSPARVRTKPDLASSVLGLRSRDLDMGEASLAFFSRFALPGPDPVPAPAAKRTTGKPAPANSATPKGTANGARPKPASADAQRGSKTQ